MNQFLKFFYELMLSMLSSIWVFIRDLFMNFWGIFDVFKYGKILDTYSGEFGVLGWILAILTIIVIVAMLFIIIYLVALLIRKYIRVRKTFVEKEELVEQIDDLNRKVIQLMREKEKILAMQVSRLGLKPGEDEIPEEEDTVKKGEASRFVKLIDIDNAYTKEPFHFTDPQNYNLEQLCDNFRNFAAGQLRLYYNIRIIRLFFSALGTTRLIILEGISGTGKTSLPYAIGKFLRNDTSIVPVQPSWRDKTELIGYLNEFTKRFNETDFLASVYEACYRDDIGLIVLDEMNLARIEYYFAEVLSILEMPNTDEWKIDIVPDVWASDPKLFKKGKLQFPTNLWFVGTANNDDSTFTITDKVYDRAVAVQINTKGVPFEALGASTQQVSSEHLNNLFAEAKKNNVISKDLMEKFDKLDDFMIVNFKLAFGNRILKQIRDFVPVYVAAGGTEIDGLDFMLKNKILRKLEGLNLSFEQENVRKLIAQLEKLYGKNNMEESKEYLRGLLKK